MPDVSNIAMEKISERRKLFLQPYTYIVYLTTAKLTRTVIHQGNFTGGSIINSKTGLLPALFLQTAFKHIDQLLLFKS